MYAITFGSDYQAASSRREHVAPLINRKVGQHGILIGSLKRNSTDDASPRVRPRGHRAEASHMCDGFYGSEIDVNGDGDKKKSRTKTDRANIREREGRRQWPRGILVEFFSPLVSTFREASAFNAYPGPHRIRMFLSLRVKRSFLHYKI